MLQHVASPCPLQAGTYPAQHIRISSPDPALLACRTPKISLPLTAKDFHPRLHFTPSPFRLTIFLFVHHCYFLFVELLRAVPRFAIDTCYRRSLGSVIPFLQARKVQTRVVFVVCVPPFPPWYVFCISTCPPTSRVWIASNGASYRLLRAELALHAACFLQTLLAPFLPSRLPSPNFASCRQPQLSFPT